MPQGLGAAWHLDYVIVTNSITGVNAKFVYKNWFDDKSGWTQTLFPEGVVPNANLVRFKKRLTDGMRDVGDT